MPPRAGRGPPAPSCVRGCKSPSSPPRLALQTACPGPTRALPSNARGHAAPPGVHRRLPLPYSERSAHCAPSGPPARCCTSSPRPGRSTPWPCRRRDPTREEASLDHWRSTTPESPDPPRTGRHGPCGRNRRTSPTAPPSGTSCAPRRLPGCP